MKTWFVTGASRGLGVEIALAALRNGDCVVASGRKREIVIERLGPDGDRMVSVALDVTDPAQAQAAVEVAVGRFGAIDVLVNNAGYGHLGFFEENTLQDARVQFETNLFGVFNVTWAALPVMRSARQGRIFNLSSVAGFMGAEFGSLYCASKFALEGFSESLAKEVAPFGLFVTIIEPGPFRTDFLTQESLQVGNRGVTDYDGRRDVIRASFEQRNGRQPGDPVKLAEAIVRLASDPAPPLRFAAGKFAVEVAGAKFAGMQAELDRWRELSLSLDGDEGAW